MLQKLTLPAWSDHPQTTSKILLINSLTLSIVFLSLLVARSLPIPSEAETLQSPAPHKTPSPSVTATPAPESILWEAEEAVAGTDVPSLIRQVPAIKTYINEIFRGNGAVAYAIAFAESGKVDKESGERYFVTTAINHTSRELSVGLFQINIRSAVARVHWNRIPGSTEEEKVEWLQNPYNNTLMAHWIFTHSSWTQWSTYTGGQYLAYVR